MSTLPRPSRPSLGPPTSPLPVAPLGPRRQSSNTSVQSISPVGGPISKLATPQPYRSPSTSSIPTTTSLASPSTSAPSAAAQERGLKKKPSYNVFPKQTVPGTIRPSSQHSTTSTKSATPRSSARGSGLVNKDSASALPTAAPDDYPIDSKKSISSIKTTSESIIEDSTGADETDGAQRGRSLHTTTKDKGNVIISVRVRPEANPKDGAGTETTPADFEVNGGESVISYTGKEGGDYSYDNVFTANDKNGKVYDAAAKRLVRRVMEGYHGTVFAYGMTGTGKTYSMQGTATSPGVIPLAITDIFSFIRETPQREFLLRVSYLEIYNERIHDLLSMPAPGSQTQQAQEEIKIREDSRRGVYVTPLKEEIVQSPTQLLRVIARGDHVRRTAGTQFNTRSSRSHAVVQIVVESRERNAGAAATAAAGKRGGMLPGGVRVSTLSLIDLAGSERAAENKERRAEGAHINKSLLTLGTVISKLSGKRDKNGQPMDKDGKHLPYRDSKLTRLLQPALSGNSLISILCTVQVGAGSVPALATTNINETLNTLKFAARARNNITSHAKRSEESHANIGDVGSRALLDRYRLEILELRKQLEDQKTDKKEDDEKVKEQARELEDQQRHEEQMLEMQLARTALKERIEHLNRLILSSKSIGVNSGRTYSTLSLANRSSAFSANESYRSLRSSTSTQTFNPALANLDEKRRQSGTSYAGTHIDDSTVAGDDDYLVDDTGDGNATLAAQLKSLQEDLADKNRYIHTLEKRLLQARRNSRSRLSSSLSNGNSLRLTEDGGIDTLVREKDDEIADLRARLEDKDRMLEALRSAARKRETAAETSRPPSVMTNDDRERAPIATESNEPTEGILQKSRRPSADSINTLNNSRRRGSLTGGSRTNSYTATSPVTTRAAQRNVTSPVLREATKRSHGVDEMTRMLDEMIRQKVEASASKSGRASVASDRSVSRSGRSPIDALTDGRKYSSWEVEGNRRRRANSGRNGTSTTGTGGSGSAIASSPTIHEVSTNEERAASSLGFGHGPIASSSPSSTQFHRRKASNKSNNSSNGPATSAPIIPSTGENIASRTAYGSGLPSNDAYNLNPPINSSSTIASNGTSSPPGPPTTTNTQRYQNVTKDEDFAQQTRGYAPPPSSSNKRSSANGTHSRNSSAASGSRASTVVLGKGNTSLPGDNEALSYPSASEMNERDLPPLPSDGDLDGHHHRSSSSSLSSSALAVGNESEESGFGSGSGGSVNVDRASGGVNGHVKHTSRSSNVSNGFSASSGLGKNAVGGFDEARAAARQAAVNTTATGVGLGLDNGHGGDASMNRDDSGLS